MNWLVTLTAAGGMIAMITASNNSDASRELGIGDVAAANLAIYHQASVNWVAANGGAGFSGVVADADALAAAPAWYNRAFAWRSNAVAGRVTTCLVVIPANFRISPANASLWKRSLEDVGAGQIDALSNFISSSRLGQSLNGAAPGCAPGSIAYVTQN